MTQLAEILPLLRGGGAAAEPFTEPSAKTGVELDALYGRLVELSAPTGAGAALTAAMRWVVQAQQANEPVAWVTTKESSFFPPDAAEGGVLLSALVVIRVPSAEEIPRVADALARSGAFGLLVLDMGRHARVPTPLLTRLSGLARKHEIALVFLSEKPDGHPSLSSLVSLRAEAVFTRPRASSRPTHRLPLWADIEEADACFQVELRVLKNKRASPGDQVMEVCRAPAGL